MFDIEDGQSSASRQNEDLSHTRIEPPEHFDGLIVKTKLSDL
jgi:hypothetical protein